MDISMNIPEWFLAIIAILMIVHAIHLIMMFLSNIIKRRVERKHQKELKDFMKSFFDNIEKDIQDHEPKEKKSFEQRINDLIEEKRKKK